MMTRHPLLKAAILCVLAGATVGCAALPTNGPGSRAIADNDAQDNVELPYSLVRITPEVVAILAKNEPRLAGGSPRRAAPAEIRFGIGDVVGVTIFESAPGGLFIPNEAGVRPGNFITLPNQNVDNAGNISVPYAGAIPAKGRTPSDVQRSIVEAIRNRAIEPQAVVTLIDQRTSLVSVFGEVNAPSRFPANAAGERVLDVITRAGGPKGQGFDTWVSLERTGQRWTVPFGALVYEPSNNVYVYPNDTIYVYREPQTFVAFGASGQQGQFNFEAWRISLAEAVGKAGGLNDSLADPGAVFIYRGEPCSVAEKLGIDCKRYGSGPIPIIYQVNFRDPSGYFLATKLGVRNKDLVYISNAPAVEVSKFLQILRLTVGTANDAVSTGVNGFILRQAIRTGNVTTTVSP